MGSSGPNARPEWASPFSASSQGVSPARPVGMSSLSQTVRGNPINGKINIFKRTNIQDSAARITPVTVDSGACDSIVPPSMFKNTKTCSHSEVGRTYGACGGEAVTNLGVKNVSCLLGNGSVKPLKFQVGDKITRGLLAVSQLAQSGAGVWFGPAPNYESFIVWDKLAKVSSNEDKLPISLINGTYQMGIVEVNGSVCDARLPQSARPVLAGADSPVVNEGEGTPGAPRGDQETPRVEP